MKMIIENKLLELLNHMKPGAVKDAASYSLMAGGKRIRPLMMLSVIEAYGLDPSDYVDVACAIEMIHTYSLIHDDLPAMDDDDMRRGKPTCHKVYGEATAILAGDALLTEAFYVITANKHLDDAKKVQLIQIFSDCAGQNGMVYGQQEDLYYEGKACDLTALQNIHHYKTARLIQASLMMGSIIAHKEDVTTWETIGRAVGQAFQIQDDILDAIGNEEELGKKTGMDAYHQKSTYVSLLGLDQAKIASDHQFKLAIDAIHSLDINHRIILDIIEGLLNRHV